MREHIDADEPFVREDVTVEEALERFRAEEQDYKVELIEDLVSDADPADPLETVSLYTNGAVHRPVPRPALAEHEADQGVQAAVGRRRLLARGLQPADAHARVWDGVLLGQGSRGATSSASSAPAPTTTAGSGPQLGLFAFSEVSPGAAFWLPRRHAGVQLAGRSSAGRWAASAATPRSRRRSSTTARCGRPPGTGRSTDEQHVRDRVRGPADGAQADELPRPLPAVLAAAATPTATCRCATPSPGCCTAASRAGRCTGCCGSATSPRTTRTSSAPRTQIQDEVAGVLEFAFATYNGVRPRRPARAVDASRAADRLRRAVGSRARLRCRTRSTASVWSTTSTRATAPSTVRRSTCT